MQTKMDVCVTIKPRAKSFEPYERLQQYGVNVTDLGNTVYVYAKTDIREDVIEKILSICNEYGDCSVDAGMVDQTPS